MGFGVPLSDKSRKKGARGEISFYLLWQSGPIAAFSLYFTFEIYEILRFPGPKRRAQQA